MVRCTCRLGFLDSIGSCAERLKRKKKKNRIIYLYRYVSLATETRAGPPTRHDRTCGANTSFHCCTRDVIGLVSCTIVLNRSFFCPGRSREGPIRSCMILSRVTVLEYKYWVYSGFSAQKRIVFSQRIPEIHTIIRTSSTYPDV